MGVWSVSTSVTSRIRYAHLAVRVGFRGAERPKQGKVYGLREEKRCELDRVMSIVYTEQRSHKV